MGLIARPDLTLSKGLIFAFRPGIQMIWSTAGIDAGVIASIAQLYSILLSTLFSINRQQLSLFDANYALVVTSSPLTIHLVFASIRELLGSRTGFFERIESHPRTIRFFGALLLPLWFGLKLTLPLSGRAFIDSELCSDPNFWNSFAAVVSISNMICYPPLVFQRRIAVPRSHLPG